MYSKDPSWNPYVGDIRSRQGTPVVGWLWPFPSRGAPPLPITSKLDSTLSDNTIPVPFFLHMEFFPLWSPSLPRFFCLFIFSQNRGKEGTKGFGQRLGGQEWWTGPFRSFWLKSEPSDPLKGFVKWFYLTCNTWRRTAIKLMSFHLNRKLLMIEWQQPATFSLRVPESTCYFLSVAERGASCESLRPVGDTTSHRSCFWEARDLGVPANIKNIETKAAFESLCLKANVLSCSVMSDSLPPHGL